MMPALLFGATDLRGVLSLLLGILLRPQGAVRTEYVDIIQYNILQLGYMDNMGYLLRAGYGAIILS